MIHFIYIAIIALLTGALTKYADYLEDTKKSKNKILKIYIGLIYGLLIALMIYLFPVVAPIWIGTIIGLIIFGEIDALSHNVGIATSFVLLFIIMPIINALLLVIFTIVNILEELVNDYFDKNPLKNKTLQKIVSARLLLEISAIIVSFIFWQWEIWIAILFYDIAYQLVTVFENRKK